MGTESSSPLPYKIQIEDDKYSFVSDFGVHYLLTLYEFSFGPETVIGSKLKRDLRVKETIVQFLSSFFAENPESAISYLCDSSDDKAFGRQRLFKRWFREANERMDSIFEYKDHCSNGNEKYQMAIVLKKSHPRKEILLELLEEEVVELVSIKDQA